MLYYLYYLKQLGIEKKGIINYPKMRKREEIILTDDGAREVEAALVRVKEIVGMDKPPELQKNLTAQSVHIMNSALDKR